MQENERLKAKIKEMEEERKALSRQVADIPAAL